MTLRDYSQRVLIIEPSSSMRQMLSDGIKTAGYQDVTGVSSAKDAVGVMEAEPVGWLLCPLMRDQEVNAFQLLKLTTAVEALRHTRITVLIEEDEQKYLPGLYEFGLLSHIVRPINKDLFGKHVAQFHERLAASDGSETKLSATYLRGYLRSSNQDEELVALEQSLMTLFPGESHYLVEIACAYHRLQNTSKAVRTFKQALMLFPADKTIIEDTAAQIFGDTFAEIATQLAAGSDHPINALGLEHCALIDSDASSLALIRNCLLESGVTADHIHEFDEGFQAWEQIQQMERLDLVVMEWRIPKLSGPALIQRIRKQFPVTPIIVLSSLIKRTDIPLLVEMGIAQSLEKPVDIASFSRALVTTVEHDRNPSSIRQVELKVDALLRAKKEDEAQSIRRRAAQDFADSKTSLLRLDAQFAYYRKDFMTARNLSLEVLRAQPDSIVMLNFLGKCLMQLHDYAAALQCLEKAQSISPQNIERLCALADVNTALGASEAAHEAVEQARDIDASSTTVLSKQVELAISEDDLEKARTIMKDLDSLGEIIAFMNNRGVAAARTGAIDKGLELYRKTIATIPDNKTDYKAIVLYNLALAHCRADQWDLAYEQLEAVVALGPARVQKKAKSLMTRIELARRRGQVVELHSSDSLATGSGSSQSTADGSEQDTAWENMETRGVTEIAPGSHCCFRVYSYTTGSARTIGNLSIALPRFKTRQAVRREETGGADRIAKNGS